MSAWIVDKVHIDLLVACAFKADRRYSPPMALRWRSQSGGQACANPGSEDAVGRMLWKENLRSVAYRYPGDKGGDRPGPCGLSDQEIRHYRFTPQSYELTIPEAFQAIACYEYQSCEHPGWNTSEAKSFCEALRDALITRIPGYDAAPWGWSRQTVEQAIAKRRALDAYAAAPGSQA